MKVNRAVFSLPLLLLAVGTGCRYSEVSEQFPGINHVEKHEKFMINLPEDHQTGETWHLNGGFDTSVVEQLNAVWHGNEKGIDFNFHSRAAGETTLSFVKRRYTDTLDSRQYVIRITGN